MPYGIATDSYGLTILTEDQSKSVGADEISRTGDDEFRILGLHSSVLKFTAPYGLRLAYRMRSSGRCSYWTLILAKNKIPDLIHSFLRYIFVGPLPSLTHIIHHCSEYFTI